MTMTSRQRVELALNHEEPDRVPVDLGGSVVTGMHVSTVYAVRQKLGLDLIGFAPTDPLEARLDEPHRPSDLATQMRTLIVVARRSFTGLNLSHHSGTRQYWGGRLIKKLDETCLKLASTLESQGVSSYPVSSLMVDLGGKDGIELCPAGQGSPLLKMAAVEAGLGTLGLNRMLLTPELLPGAELYTLMLGD